MRLIDEQAALRDAAASFIEGRFPLDAVRASIDDPSGVDEKYLAQTAELGWYAAFIPEEYGGGTASGSPITDAAIISEQRGRGLQPGPFVSTNVVAAALSSQPVTAELGAMLEGLATGRFSASWAAADAMGQWCPDVLPTLVATGDRLTLDGRLSYVQDGASSDWFLVLARRDGARCQVLLRADTPGITVRPMHTFDLTARLADVTFADVTVAATDVIDCTDDALDRQLQLAALLVTADEIGAMDRLLEISVKYAKERQAFGRPIGSFQAIKHLLANVALVVEASKVVTASAVEALVADAVYAVEVVSMAKSYVADGGFEVAQGCLQVHGGIGYAWEHDLHLFLRRLAGDSALYGDGDAHRRRIFALNDAKAM